MKKHSSINMLSFYCEHEDLFPGWEIEGEDYECANMFPFGMKDSLVQMVSYNLRLLIHIALTETFNEET